MPIKSRTDKYTIFIQYICINIVKITWMIFTMLNLKNVVKTTFNVSLLHEAKKYLKLNNLSFGDI